MSKLEDIVPPLELCKHIPAGEFEDSALVWLYWAKDESSFGNVVPRILKDQFSSILPGLGAVLKAEVPAPTLAEILDELGNKTVCLYAGIHYEVSVCIRECDSGTKEHQWRQYGEADRNPAAAALRLWLKVKGNGDE